MSDDAAKTVIVPLGGAVESDVDDWGDPPPHDANTSNVASSAGGGLIAAAR